MKDKRAPRKQHAFRLSGEEISIIDRTRDALAKSTEREVTRSQAVRAILEGFLRGKERRRNPDLPYLSDAELLNHPRVK